MLHFLSEWWNGFFPDDSPKTPPPPPPVPDSITAGGPEIVAAYKALTGTGPKTTPQGTGQFMECDLLHVSLTSAQAGTTCGVDGCVANIHPLPTDTEHLQAKVFQLATQNLQLRESAKAGERLAREEVKLTEFWRANFNPDFTNSLSIVDMCVLKLRELQAKTKAKEDTN